MSLMIFEGQPPKLGGMGISIPVFDRLTYLGIPVYRPGNGEAGIKLFSRSVVLRRLVACKIRGP